MFLTDSQTITDLSLFTKGSSVFELYNRTQTSGGSDVLEEFFRFPMDNIGAIENRLFLIEAFGAADTKFPFDRTLMDTIEGYLSQRDERSAIAAVHQGLKQKVSEWVVGDATYKNIQKGISCLIDLMLLLDQYVQSKYSETTQAGKQYCQGIQQLLHEGVFDTVFLLDREVKLSNQQYTALDQLFRFRGYHQIKKILRYVYEIDVFCSIFRLARDRQWCFARPVGSGQISGGFEVVELKHPLVENAVGNDLVMDQQHNLIFLTGANMAGKSTLMKSIALALYLAHLGMPVTAKQMKFTVMDGLYSTINLPDNLGMGASHFYAEVLRVKKVAKELSVGKRLIVLFDELFRGTNVKDAAEATVAVLEGFARKKESLFVVSTHIMEAAGALSRRTDQARYRYLPTRMKEGRPLYSYKLQEGVTEDRHGMVIIKNEGILQLLANGLQHSL